ncbi:MAG: ATPase, partial [Mastigocladus sp. ERB_26_1]
RVNPYLSELIRVPVNANASQSAPPGERPVYRLYRDDQEIPAADLPMQYAAFHNTVVRDEVVDIVHPDGTVIKLLCYASPLLDEQGNVRGVIGGFADITQRIQKEVALREQRTLLETILRQAADGIIVCDATGKLTFVNKEARRLAQQDPDGTTLDLNLLDWGTAYDTDGNLIPLES